MASLISIKRSTTLLIFPILIAFCGILFSWEAQGTMLRAVMVLISLAVPLLACGNYFARYRTTWFERGFFLFGLLLLVTAAVFTLASFGESIRGGYGEHDALRVAIQGVGFAILMLALTVIVVLSLRSELDIAEAGERFWQLADHISDGFILSKPDGTILLVNQRLLEMLNFERQELVGKNVYELARKYSAESVLADYPKRAEGVASEYEMYWKVEGQEKRLSFSGMPIRNARNKHTATLATIRDVTEQHRLSRRVERYAQGLQRLVEEQSQKLQHYEDRYRRLLLSINEGFLTVDAANCIRLANGRICKLLRREMNELVGKSIFDFIEPAGRMRLLNILARGAEVQGAEARLELDFVSADGQVVPTFVAVTHIGDTSEWESVFSMVITNVSQLKNMQRQSDLRAQELEQVNEELRMHGRAKDGFLSNVTHELRTPLSTIAGYVEMLESGSLGALEPAQDGALKVMRRNVERLMGHINEMIEFSRMEIQGVQLVVRLFSPAKLVHEAVASIHPHILAKSITTTVIMPEDFPQYAWADRDKLGQVLTILLNNAVKFTDPNGSISVDVSQLPGHTLRIAVTDSGIGIDKIHQDQIFKKFFQVDSSKTRRYEGTGIGLSIASSIVQAHNGTLEVQSELGKGSTFIITLPSAIYRAECNPEDTQGFDTLKIILVNEASEFKHVVGDFLESRGCRVWYEDNGFNCVRTAEKMQPNLILINDWRSDRDGAQVIQALRDNQATHHLPVIVFCGEILAEHREMANIWDDVYFVLLPFDAFVIIDRIRLACFGESQVESCAVRESITTRQAPNPHVLVVDADPGMLEWVETALHLSEIPCCCAPTPEKALEMIGGEPPDIVFLDADLPVDQVEAHIALLHQSGTTHTAPIYLMTGVPGEMLRVEAATGVLQKPFTLDALVERIYAARDERAAAGQAPEN